MLSLKRFVQLARPVSGALSLQLEEVEARHLVLFLAQLNEGTVGGTRVLLERVVVGRPAVQFLEAHVAACEVRLVLGRAVVKARFRHSLRRALAVSRQWPLCKGSESVFQLVHAEIRSMRQYAVDAQVDGLFTFLSHGAGRVGKTTGS